MTMQLSYDNCGLNHMPLNQDGADPTDWNVESIFFNLPPEQNGRHFPDDIF